MDREIKSLTALRGIAAAGVLAFHVGAPIPGYLCVDLFFMLSGFVLMHAYSEHFARSVSGAAYWRFLRARLARIYPVHILTILLLLPLFGSDPSFSLGALIHNLLLTQGPWLSEASWNYGAWSISAEWHAYLIFPFLVVVVSARSRVATITIGALSLVAVTAAVTIHGSSNIATTPAVLLRCLPEFVLGMAVYRAYREGWIAGALASDRFCAGATVAIVAFAVVGGWIADTGIRWTLPLVLVACAMNRGLTSRFLNTWPLQYLGRISYSLYMVQMVSQFLLLELFPDIGAMAHGAAFIVLSVSLAIPISHLVEYPARDWLRGGKSADGAATAVGMLTLAARFRRSGAMYRNHGSDRDSPLEVNIGPGVSAT